MPEMPLPTDEGAIPNLVSLSAEEAAHAMCLHVAQVDMQFDQHYRNLMRSMVFSQEIEGMSAEDKISYQSLLLRHQAKQILTMIWKEAGNISYDLMKAVEIEPTFYNKDLTAHTMAVEFAEKTKEVASINNHINAICIAASKYKLIYRVEDRRTKKRLVSSELLGSFMFHLRAAQAADMMTAFSFIVPAITHGLIAERRTDQESTVNNPLGSVES